MDKKELATVVLALEGASQTELFSIARIIADEVGPENMIIADNLYDQQKLEIIYEWYSKMTLEEIQSLDKIVKSIKLNKAAFHD